MKILTVLGARPQFIKSKVVSTLLKFSPGVSEIILLQKAREYFRNNLEFYKNSHASSVITNNIISKFG